MRHFFVVVILLTAVAPVKAQPLIGLVMDSAGAALPFASVGVVNTPHGTVADQTGRFTLYLTSHVKPTDTVRISLLGYRSVAYSVGALIRQLVATPHLTLQEEVRMLGEVKIDARASRVKTLGKTGHQTSKVTNFALNELPRQNLGSEIGRKFNLLRGMNRLEKYQFYIISNFDSLTFRINVYRAKDMQNLLSQNIYVTTTGRARKWVEVDLMPYQIITSDDVIVSVQWINSVGKGPALQMPIQMPAVATHYYRYGSQDRWRKFRGMTTSMNLTFTHSQT